MGWWYQATGLGYQASWPRKNVLELHGSDSSWNHGFPSTITELYFYIRISIFLFPSQKYVLPRSIRVRRLILTSLICYIFWCASSTFYCKSKRFYMSDFNLNVFKDYLPGKVQLTRRLSKMSPIWSLCGLRIVLQIDVYFLSTPLSWIYPFHCHSTIKMHRINLDITMYSVIDQKTHCCLGHCYDVRDKIIVFVRQPIRLNLNN